jgi:hypothetical protein
VGECAHERAERSALRCIFWLLAMLGAGSAALAQRAEQLLPSAVGLRRDARLAAHDLAELRLPTTLREVDWKLTAGIAATRAENGERIVSTPFQLRARFNEGRTALKLSGSGYSDVRSEGHSAAGFNDVYLMLNQLVAPGLIAEGGASLPAGGEIGSSDTRERVGAIYNHGFSRRWDGQLHARLTHYEGEVRPGVARVREQGLAQVAYNLDAPRSDVLVQLLRTYRRGARSASSAAIVYEFPLAQKRRAPMAAVGFTRGLTAGARDNTLEVDLSLRF